MALQLETKIFRIIFFDVSIRILNVTAIDDEYLRYKRSRWPLNKILIRGKEDFACFAPAFKLKWITVFQTNDFYFVFSSCKTQNKSFSVIHIRIYQYIFLIMRMSSSYNILYHVYILYHGNTTNWNYWNIGTKGIQYTPRQNRTNAGT